MCVGGGATLSLGGIIEITEPKQLVLVPRCTKFIPQREESSGAHSLTEARMERPDLQIL